MDVYVTLIGCGEGPVPVEQKCTLVEPATVADLMLFLGLRPQEAMLVFVDTAMAQAHTELHDGAQVHFCAFICGG